MTSEKDEIKSNYNYPNNVKISPVYTGRGERKVTITGLDENGKKISETITI